MDDGEWESRGRTQEEGVRQGRAEEDGDEAEGERLGKKCGSRDRLSAERERLLARGPRDRLEGRRPPPQRRPMQAQPGNYQMTE